MFSTYTSGRRKGVASASLSLVAPSPATGPQGAASAPFQVTLGHGSGTVNVTISITGGAGTLSTTTLALTPASPTGYFTLTPLAQASYSISVTNDAGLANPAPVSYQTSSTGSSFPSFPSSGIVVATLKPAASLVAPVSIGHAFRQGDLPAGSFISGAQLDVHNTWPDGSAKTATVTVGASFSAGTPVPLGIAIGAGPPGGALTTANLKATGATAAIGCGSYGSVTWSNADWDSPFATWCSGPLMSSWVYRKPVGGDPFLVGWLEVRCYVDGSVEALPWVENGYLQVAGPTSKSGIFTFAFGGTQRESLAITLPAQCRTPVLSGTKLSHWLGPDPLVQWVHDKAYLQATLLVPTYGATVANGASVVTSLVSSFTPLQQGNFDYAGDTMGAPGYTPCIGLLPQWDVLYLTANSGAELGAVIRQGYSAGRYPVHFRDETTNRPPAASAYPHLSSNASSTNQLVPAATGAAPPTWDIPHHCSIGFMAYLLTGRWYFMEQIQFAATANWLGMVDSYRSFGLNVFVTDHGPETVRGSAWQMRTLAQTIHATADSDPLRAEFVGMAQNNIGYFYSTFAGQAGNILGWVSPYGNYGYDANGNNAGAYYDVPWMEDFFTAAWGYLLRSGAPVDSTHLAQLKAFMAWKAKTQVVRLGPAGAGNFLYSDACPYTMACAPSATTDWNGGTGPWFANAGAAYSATYSGASNPTTDPQVLRGGNFPDATSYWGNIAPAISYALDLALSGQATIPGASLAYSRMANATNFGQLLVGNGSGSTCYDNAPVWGVVPRMPIATAIVASVTGIVGQVATIQLSFNGPFSDPLTVTPSSSDCSFSPATAVIPANGTVTFTATATGNGAHSVSFANPANLANPSGFGFTTGFPALPAWVAALPLWQWYSIPNTALSSVAPSPTPLGITGPVSKITTWQGAALKRAGSVYMIGIAGGHTDYSGNEVDALTLSASTPAWSQVKAPTDSANVYATGTQFNADLSPSATHTYQSQQFLNGKNQFICMPAPGYVGPHTATPPGGWPYAAAAKYIFVLDWATKNWKPPTDGDYYAQAPDVVNAGWTANICCMDPTNDKVYYQAQGGGAWVFDPNANTWTQTFLYDRNPQYGASAFDFTRQRYLVVGDPSQSIAPIVYPAMGTPIHPTFGGLGQSALLLPAYSGMVYDEANDCYLILSNNSDGTTTLLTRVEAGTWVVSLPTTTGTAPVWRQNGINNSFQYVPELRGVVIADTYTGNVKFMRTSA